MMDNHISSIILWLLEMSETIFHHTTRAVSLPTSLTLLSWATQGTRLWEASYHSWCKERISNNVFGEQTMPPTSSSNIQVVHTQQSPVLSRNISTSYSYFTGCYSVNDLRDKSFFVPTRENGGCELQLVYPACRSGFVNKDQILLFKTASPRGLTDYSCVLHNR